MGIAIYISIIIILLFVLGILLFLLIAEKKKAQPLPQKVAAEKILPQHLELEKLQNEIKRLSLINEELKNKKSSATKQHQVAESDQQNIQSRLEFERIKQVVDQEKELFRAKNKKLWDQSVAIHKERDEIDNLRKKIEAKHKEVVDSINYAQRIQQALVSGINYLDANLNDYFLFWRPRNVVSGDFYWALRRKNDFLIVVADCTGHGVPGAFMSLLGISFLNEITALNPDILPDQILEQMRTKVKKALQQTESSNKDGMDMACLIINEQNKTVTFAGANAPLWIIRNNELSEIKPVKNPIGIYLRESQFVQHVYNYQPDDLIFMFSDGYIDQFGGKHGRKFMKANLKTSFLNLAAQRITMKTMGQKVEDEFDQWKYNFSQTDDVIVFGARM